MLLEKTDLNNWNCNNSCLQALALSPRSETVDSRGGRSPMISPHPSPQLQRRGTVPVAPPPPLPPRRSSPTLGSPTSSPRPQPAEPTLQRQHSGGNAHSIHYAELADISEEPSYENTVIIPGNPAVVKHIYNVSFEGELSSSQKTKNSEANKAYHGVPGSHLDSGGSSRTSSTPRHSKDLAETQKQNHQRAGVSETNVAYENLNMDYIAQLMSEGYTQDAVIRALGITRNDVEMAWDILHEFASKETTT
ncbi:Uncharacterized protein GBIM_17050 [Gryllus bimaculatus]|nr:Uncharacterized protein GBIM_17050 [Gryllus bimaculatus]